MKLPRYSHSHVIFTTVLLLVSLCNVQVLSSKTSDARNLLAYSCTVAPVPEGVQLTFAGETRGSSENLLVDGNWEATVTGLGTYIVADGDPISKYTVRLRGNGYTTEPDGFTTFQCTQQIDPSDYSCTYKQLANGQGVQLTFSGDSRGSSENLLVDDTWEAVVTGLTSYVVADGDSTSFFTVRLRGNGYTVGPDGYTTFQCIFDDFAGQDWVLIWEDTFDGANSVDTTKWQVFSGSYGTPYRLQQYTADNVRVEQGSLFLKATTDGQNYYSGMVTTNDSRNSPNPAWAQGNLGWTYGKFEVRAKLPHGYGLWPAIWMRPISDLYTGFDGSGGWPTNGEIDIMEYIGPGRDPNQPNAPINQLVQNIHYEDRNGNRKQQKNTFDVSIDSVQSFHVYGLEWEEGTLRFYFDGNLVHSILNWDSFQGAPKPFDQPFDIIINLQIGGWAGPPDPQDYPAEMEIDWVKVYERGELPSAPSPPPVPVEDMLSLWKEKRSESSSKSTLSAYINQLLLGYLNV